MHPGSEGRGLTLTGDSSHALFTLNSLRERQKPLTLNSDVDPLSSCQPGTLTTDTAQDLDFVYSRCFSSLQASRQMVLKKKFIEKETSGRSKLFDDVDEPMIIKSKDG